MAGATFVRRILIPIFVLGFAVAHAQTITKVSGDGQLVIQSRPGQQPNGCPGPGRQRQSVAKCKGHLDSFPHWTRWCGIRLNDD